MKPILKRRSQPARPPKKRPHLVPRVDEDPVTIMKTGARKPRGDFYVRLLSASWERLVIFFVASFLLINAVFAVIYFLIGGIENTDPSSFAEVFFFSVQTLSTVGYGHWAPVSFAANIVATIELMISILFAAVVTGLVFAKFSHPTARVIFSNVAVIADYNGVPHLMFRLANQRNNRIVDARMHVALLRKEVTSEGLKMRRFHDLALVRQQMPILQLSWTVMHPIDKASPLYGNLEKLKEWDGEIVVSLSGLDETFSQIVHARHSYLAEDIIEGAVFIDVVSRREGDNIVDIDLSKMHDFRRTANKV